MRRCTAYRPRIAGLLCVLTAAAAHIQHAASPADAPAAAAPAVALSASTDHSSTDSPAGAGTLQQVKTPINPQAKAASHVQMEAAVLRVDGWVDELGGRDGADDVLQEVQRAILEAEAVLRRLKSLEVRLNKRGEHFRTDYSAGRSAMEMTESVSGRDSTATDASLSGPTSAEARQKLDKPADGPAVEQLPLPAEPASWGAFFDAHMHVRSHVPAPTECKRDLTCTFIGGAFIPLRRQDDGYRAKTPASASRKRKASRSVSHVLMRVWSMGPVDARAIGSAAGAGNDWAVPVMYLGTSRAPSAGVAAAFSPKFDPWMVVADRSQATVFDIGFRQHGRAPIGTKLAWPSSNTSAATDSTDDPGVVGLQGVCSVDLPAAVTSVVTYSVGGSVSQNSFYLGLANGQLLHVRKNCSIALDVDVSTSTDAGQPIHMLTRRGTLLAVATAREIALVNVHAKQASDQVCSLPIAPGGACAHESERITSLSFDRNSGDILWVSTSCGHVYAYNVRYRMPDGETTCKLVQKVPMPNAAAPAEAAALGRYLIATRRGALHLFNVSSAMRGDLHELSNAPISVGAEGTSILFTEPSPRGAVDIVLAFQPRSMTGDAVLIDCLLPGGHDEDADFSGVLGWLRFPMIVAAIIIIVLMQLRGSDRQGAITKLVELMGGGGRGAVGNAMRAIMGRHLGEADDEEHEFIPGTQSAFGRRRDATADFDETTFQRDMDHLRSRGDYDGMLEAVLSQARQRRAVAKSSQPQFASRGAAYGMPGSRAGGRASTRVDSESDSSDSASEPDGVPGPPDRGVDAVLARLQARAAGGDAAAELRAARLGARGISDGTPPGTQEWAAMQAAMASFRSSQGSAPAASAEHRRARDTDDASFQTYVEAAEVDEIAHLTAARVAAARRAAANSPSGMELERVLASAGTLDTEDVRKHDEPTIESQPAAPGRPQSMHAWAQRMASAADAGVLEPDSDED